MIDPLSFTDPEMRRETYVAAFITTLNDKSDGQPSVEKSIMILLAYGYHPSDIAAHVDQAHKMQWSCLTGSKQPTNH